jgi:hypothetical protein
VSLFLPSEVYQERIIRVYLKTNEKEQELITAVEKVKDLLWLNHFFEWQH